MSNTVKLSGVAIIIVLGMILSSAILSKFFVRIRHEQAITVKGYAEQNVTSDIGKFTCTCSERGTSLKEAFEKLQKSRMATQAFLKRMGIRDEEAIPATIETAKILKRAENGKETNETEYYDVAQTITVTSTNVTLIQDVSTRITDLIQDGIDIKASPPAFFISDLKDIKLGLLAMATDDGYRRAVALADNSRGKVGSLISAQQGVLQITERNSTDTSGYGEYDTSTIGKTAKAVVTLEYAIETSE